MKTLREEIEEIVAQEVAGQSAAIAFRETLSAHNRDAKLRRKTSEWISENVVRTAKLQSALDRTKEQP